MFSSMDCPKILILRLSAIGDVVRTLPAVKALKANLPFSSITWLIEEPSKTLIETQPEIDEVILFPRNRWLESIKTIKGVFKTIREIWEFIYFLRSKKFDIVLDFHGIFKSGLISLLSGSPNRIGFDRETSKEFNFLFSNIRVSLSEERISRFKKNYSLLRGIGLEVKDFTPELYIPEEDRNYIESFFHKISKKIKHPLIAIHAGTSPKTSYKRWMPEQYATLADRLVEELGATVIFTWGPGELAWVEGIKREMKKESFIGPQTLSLIQLGEVYRHCDLYIGGDTGPMHIASLIGVPVVIIYGPTDPIINEPLGIHKKVIKEVGCNPCRNRSCKELTCLKAISVEDVLQATKEILSSQVKIN